MKIGDYSNVLKNLRMVKGKTKNKMETETIPMWRQKLF